ncbi:hypothetical protein [Shewanella sp. BJSY2023SW005]|uniref:hypothetical protein n=1 Tax=Shewanella sp. BJSY2023SW005 TaxID=3392043 RepID=UPI0039B57379
MNTLYSATRINSINDSAMVLVDGKYKGQVMPMTDLRELLKADTETVTWTRKVLKNRVVVERSMEFDKASLIQFATSYLRPDVFEQLSTDEFVERLRGKSLNK